MPSGDVLTFPATRAGFADAFVRFRAALGARALLPKSRYRGELAFDEVVANIIRHGYRDQHEHEIRVTLTFTSNSLVLTFEDDGVPFDPTAHQSDNRRTASLEETQVGGRGLLLVRAAARGLEYERTPDGRNRLIVTVDAAD